MRFILFYLLVAFSQPLHAAKTEEITKIFIEKSKRKMTLLDKNGKVLKTYKVSLGPTPKGHKQQEGDGKTPEGAYTIAWHNAHSLYHKSLKISYPNAADKKAAQKAHRNPGGDIFIHGLGKSFAHLGKLHTLYDWTLGCIAVTNEEIDEIYGLVKAKTEVKIVP